MRDWYEYQYAPIAEMVKEERVLDAFPDRTELDLYLWIANHRERLALEARNEGILPEAAKDDILRQSRRRRLQVPNIPVPGRSPRVRPRDAADPEDPTRPGTSTEVLERGVAFWAPRRSLYLGAGSGPWGRGHRAQGAGGLRRPGRLRDAELAAVSVLGSVTRAQFGDQPGLPPGALENLVAVTEGEARSFSVPAPFVWWVAVSPVRQRVTRFFGGEGPLSAMLAVVGAARMPLALGALVQPWGRGCRRRSRSRAPPGRSPVFWAGSSRSAP